jgi:hypothetical protein
MRGIPLEDEKECGEHQKLLGRLVEFYGVMGLDFECKISTGYLIS